MANAPSTGEMINGVFMLIALAAFMVAFYFATHHPESSAGVWIVFLVIFLWCLALGRIAIKIFKGD